VLRKTPNQVLCATALGQTGRILGRTVSSDSGSRI